ncbi:MAG: hydrogenase subunit MbhD domain-containing protein [Candidatus Aenigmatarchaeota archaeon]
MIFAILSFLIIIFSILAIRQKDLLIAVIFLSLASMSLAITYLLLQAPDIAITEAAVNAGLTTLIFVIAIKKTRRFEE